MKAKPNPHSSLAASITKSASKQTYYTIRFFVDRPRVADAYLAYGYFRWVDDSLDDQPGAREVKLDFIQRQQVIMETCYRGEALPGLCVEEQLLAELIAHDTEKQSGLQAYLRNMMAVMAFDAARRGQVISQDELSSYTHSLATAVTEAMHYFIGHNDPAPDPQLRYQAVTAAHITHMLRDTIEDTAAGYFNIPGEYLQLRAISPHDIKSRAYREWVCKRVRLAREHFKVGRASLAQVKSLRCRLAGYAYTARFEWMLRTIERDNYCLRTEYPERKSLRASLWMGYAILISTFAPLWSKFAAHHATKMPCSD